MYNKKLSELISSTNIVTNLQNKNTKEENNSFIKIEFYRDGSYKDIYTPYNLSYDSYNDFREILDLILPINNDYFFVEEINETTIEERRIDKIMENNILRRLNEKDEQKFKKFKIRKIKRNLEKDEDENGFLVNDENSEDKYYIKEKESEIIEPEEVDQEKEEEKNTTILMTKKESKKNITKIHIYKDSAVYSDLNFFRGSGKIKNIYIDFNKSNNAIQNYRSITHINLTRQNLTEYEDKYIYNKNNYIERRSDLIDRNETNKTEITIDSSNISSIISIAEQNIINIITFSGGEIIDKIYEKYINKFDYEQDNSTTKMKRRLKNLISNDDFNNYEIIEIDNNKRNLEELNEVKKYYGLKMQSQRKDIVKLNFLGKDISLGIVNSYYPDTGESYNYLKLDIDKRSIINKPLQTFTTNEHIIIENIQQMGYKLIESTFSSHKNLEEKNTKESQIIHNIFEKLTGTLNFNGDIRPKYSYIEDYYKLLFDNTEKYQREKDDLLNSFKKIKNNIVNNINSKTIFNSSELNINKYLSNFKNNIINEINSKIYNINETIMEINEEIINNKGKGFHPYLYEYYRKVMGEINNYINIGIDKNLKSQLVKGENSYISKINDKINNKINFNKIESLLNSINTNIIFDKIFSRKEKDDIINYLKFFQNLVRNNADNTSIQLNSSFKKD